MMRRLTSGAETGPARLAVKIDGIGAVDAQAVTDAVETGQVGAGLGGGDDVISGHGVIGVRAGKFPRFPPRVFQIV